MADRADSKRIKLDTEVVTKVVSDDEQDFHLSDFIFERVLKANSNRKLIFLLGSIKGKEGHAILTLEKKAFNEADLNEKGYFCDENLIKQHFHNDIYRNFDCFPKPGISGLKVSLIHPATEKHILKFSEQKVRLVLETPHIYQTVTKPFIEKEQFNLEWLYNILDGTKEADRVVYSDLDEATGGFVLLPDLKWDGKSPETLYLCAIARRPILSLRELNTEHLPLLRHIKNKGEEAILKRYGLERSQLRIYVHYQPTYYHLHFHFTSLTHEAPGISTEKSHLLDTIIDNIEMLGDYYQRATLPCVLGEGDTLYRLIREGQVK